MDEDEQVEFSSVEEELCYWKQNALKYKASWIAAQEELEEFTIGSRELETELEAQLEQAEGRTRELHATNQRLINDLEILKEKLEQQHGQSYQQISSLEEQLAQITAIKDAPMSVPSPSTPRVPGDIAFEMPVTPRSKGMPNGYGSSPLTPSARISALNIVGDLLRKVSALECKLASCKNVMRDQQLLGKVSGGLSGTSRAPHSPSPPSPGHDMGPSKRLERASYLPFAGPTPPTPASPPGGMQITV
uniref:Ndel1b n=1 Tax=Petromyzon marinus TaxID=7757 RepID=L7S1T5_PETMA|nr:Ndel1b [Petromyzon marinus]